MSWSELYDCMISNGSSTCDTLSDSEYFRALARRWSGVQISRSFWTSTTWSDNRRSHEEMLPDTHWRLCWNMIIQHHPKHRGVQFPRHSTSIPHVIWVMSYSTTRRIASQHLHLGAAALWDCFFDATSNMLITQYMLDIFRYLVHPCSCMFIVHILLSFQKHLVSWVGLFLPGFPAFGSSASKTSLRSAVLAVSNLAFNWRSNKNYSNCFGTKRTHKHSQTTYQSIIRFFLLLRFRNVRNTVYFLCSWNFNKLYMTCPASRQSRATKIGKNYGLEEATAFSILGQFRYLSGHHGPTWMRNFGFPWLIMAYVAASSSAYLIRLAHSEPPACERTSLRSTWLFAPSRRTFIEAALKELLKGWENTTYIL